MANAEPFIKRIYARQNFRLVTAIEQVDLKATDDRLVRFGSEADYESLLELGLFVECINNRPEPIVHQAALSQSIADAPIQPAQAPAVRAQQDVETRVEAGVITQQDDNILCPKCNCPMILSVDTADPANIKDVMYCPGCQYSYETGNKPADHVQAPPEVTPAPKPAQSAENTASEPPKAARVMSRCDCGRVKAATSSLCKNCTADMQAA